MYFIPVFIGVGDREVGNWWGGGGGGNWESYRVTIYYSRRMGIGLKHQPILRIKQTGNIPKVLAEPAKTDYLFIC